MKQLQLFTALFLAACMFLTACGGSLTNDHDNAASESAVSGASVSGQSVTEGVFPTKMIVKTPYDYEEDENNYEAVFTIKESTSQEYRAEFSLRVNLDDIYEIPEFHWELYLDLADEIKEISGASILSHEGTHYIIRGDIPKHSPDDGRDEEWMDEYKLSFKITAAYHGKINEPRFCFFSKQLYSLDDKNFDCQLVDLEKEGDSLAGKIRLTNRSGEKIPGWELEMDTNFRITSLNGSEEGFSSLAYSSFDDGSSESWRQRMCSTTKNLDLNAGETKEIPFTGICHAKKPMMETFILYEQYEADKDDTWYALEDKFGGSFGKMDEYLLADTVFGMDVFFVFDEKKKDHYTATAELTNVVPFGFIDSEEEYDIGQSIADWEIYLECEDNIENITGAEIVSHEGNVYHIRAEDPDKWISPFSFTTFQVEVSCPEGIHPLGKTYLTRAKVKNTYGSDTAVKEQKFTMDESSFKKAAGTRWLSYRDFYDPWYDTDGLDDAEECEGFFERQKWGKKMGRMPK